MAADDSPKSGKQISIWYAEIKRSIIKIMSTKAYEWSRKHTRKCTICLNMNLYVNRSGRRHLMGNRSLLKLRLRGRHSSVGRSFWTLLTVQCCVFDLLLCDGGLHTFIHALLCMMFWCWQENYQHFRESKRLNLEPDTSTNRIVIIEGYKHHVWCSNRVGHKGRRPVGYIIQFAV